MRNEQWLNKIKESLEEYSEPIPASGWERLEKEIATSGVSATGKRRTLLRHWAVAAAASVLVAVSSFCFWLLEGEAGKELREQHTPALSMIPDSLPAQPASAQRIEEMAPTFLAHEQTKRDPAIQESNRIATEPTTDASAGTDNLPPISETTKGERETEEDNRQEVTKDNVEPEAATVKQKQLPNLEDETWRTKRGASRKSGGWSIGLSAGNSGSFNLQENSSSYHPNYAVLSDGNSFLAAIDGAIPTSGNNIFLASVMPRDMLNRVRSVKSIHHKQPLSAGFSVRKNLPHGFSVETGLTYTYLASEILFENQKEEVEQKLHYMGIPLRANWNFVDTRSFTVYVSAGGAVEKCVYGRIDHEQKTVKPLQFSVMGTVGAQYNVSSKLGLYVEPGVSYFFDDGSDVQTIRKESPCNFTLQAGVRLTY